MNKFLKIFIAFLAFFFAGCDFRDKNVLKVATSADFPPYAFKGQNNEIEGIDIEIAKEIAARLNLNVAIKNMPFDTIIDSVASGKANIGINGITVIEERKKSINFSKTYDTSKQAIVVKENSQIKNINDLYDKKAKYKVGVQTASTGALYFQYDIANKNLASSIVEYQNGLNTAADLLADKIDCIIIDLEQANSFVKKNKGLKILETKYVEEEYAIVVNKDKLELLDGINMVLEDMKLDGTIEKIRNKYIK